MNSGAYIHKITGILLLYYNDCCYLFWMNSFIFQRHHFSFEGQIKLPDVVYKVMVRKLIKSRKDV